MGTGKPRGAVTAYIGLGSNLEDPIRQVTGAVEEIAELDSVRLTGRSSLYRSAPLGPPDQPYYINAVVQVACSISADCLLNALQQIETAHDRQRGGIRWGPRTLDLDILLFGEKIINTARMTIPHAGLYERPFVLYPLQEIAPDLVIPGFGALSKLIQVCGPGELEKMGDMGLLANNNDNDT